MMFCRGALVPNQILLLTQRISFVVSWTCVCKIFKLYSLHSVSECNIICVLLLFLYFFNELTCILSLIQKGKAEVADETEQTKEVQTGGVVQQTASKTNLERYAQDEVEA